MAIDRTSETMIRHLLKEIQQMEGGLSALDSVDSETAGVLCVMVRTSYEALLSEASQRSFELDNLLENVDLQIHQLINLYVQSHQNELREELKNIIKTLQLQRFDIKYLQNLAGVQQCIEQAKNTKPDSKEAFLRKLAATTLDNYQNKVWPALENAFPEISHDPASIQTHYQSKDEHDRPSNNLNAANTKNTALEWLNRYKDLESAQMLDSPAELAIYVRDAHLRFEDRLVGPGAGKLLNFEILSGSYGPLITTLRLADFLLPEFGKQAVFDYQGDLLPYTVYNRAAQLILELDAGQNPDTLAYKTVYNLNIASTVHGAVILLGEVRPEQFSFRLAERLKVLDDRIQTLNHMPLKEKPQLLKARQAAATCLQAEAGMIQSHLYLMPETKLALLAFFGKQPLTPWYSFKNPSKEEINSAFDTFIQSPTTTGKQAFPHKALNDFLEGRISTHRFAHTLELFRKDKRPSIFKVWRWGERWRFAALNAASKSLFKSYGKSQFKIEQAAIDASGAHQKTELNRTGNLGGIYARYAEKLENLILEFTGEETLEAAEKSAQEVQGEKEFPTSLSHDLSWMLDANRDLQKGSTKRRLLEDVPADKRELAIMVGIAQKAENIVTKATLSRRRGGLST